MKVRPIRVEGDVAYVPLTRGYEAIIDASDVPLVSDYNWSVLVDRSNFYAVRKQYFAGKYRTFLMHRLLLDCPSGVLVDHKDGQGLNNRRSNLRFATSSQNAMNRRLTKSNTSGLKGAVLHKKTGKWQAGIKIAGMLHYLGLFPTAADAHAAYIKASVIIHGDFRRPS